jgi:hypothetical protein
MTPPPQDPAQPRLDRAPGERYRTVPGAGGHADGSAPVPWTRRRRVALAAIAAVAGGLLTLILGGLDVGPGLVVVAATTGWLAGLLLAGGAATGRGPDAGPRRAAGAAVLGCGGVAVGLLGDGVRALSEGGVLNPVAYVAERYGPLALVLLAAAAVGGLLRGR